VTDRLSPDKCRECGKSIMVARYSPHALESEATGVAAEQWDADTQQFYHVGYICGDCVSERIGPGKPGALAGPSLTFYYS
jgi:hypothetical protein